jgi:hypothetical protein
MASGSKDDIFGIDDAGEFKRPDGTLANCTCRPGDKSPGYSHVSLRDKPELLRLTFKCPNSRSRSQAALEPSLETSRGPSLVRFPGSLEGVHRPKGKLCGSVYIHNSWLQLQKILPRALFVNFGIRFVTHGRKHTAKICDLCKELGVGSSGARSHERISG